MFDRFLSRLGDFGDDVVRRILNVLICLDQFIFCIITLGNSAPDETMSAAAWRLEKKGRLAGQIFRPLIDTLLFFDKDHCRRAHEAEIFGWQDGS